MKEDGFILSKNRGRTDALNKWSDIKKKLLDELSDPNEYEDELHLLTTTITEKDEWIIQAHSKADYSNLTVESFIKSIKAYVIFLTKSKLGLLSKEIDELTLLEILNENNISAQSIHFDKSIKIIKSEKVDTTNWKEFTMMDLFKKNMKRGMRLIEIDRIMGDCNYYSASAKDNGLTDMIANPLFTEKDCLIYSTFGDCFYVEGEFTASDEITILKHEKMNKFSGLFLATVLKENKYKYGFGRKAFLNKLVKDTIKLPVDKEQNPNWQYMEDYIKSLPYSQNLDN
ncbi:MAG: hypothetical protein NTW67_06790 [Candidatus Woesearchaeota archaeon]|nr:hypothetical protein [Candidatus Woesearchaeota archaeon]